MLIFLCAYLVIDRQKYTETLYTLKHWCRWKQSRVTLTQDQPTQMPASHSSTVAKALSAEHCFSDFSVTSIEINTFAWALWACMSARVCVLTCVCVCVRMLKCMWARVCVCACMFASVLTCGVRVRVWSCVCACLGCVCVYLRAWSCMCVKDRKRLPYLQFDKAREISEDTGLHDNITEVIMG